MQVNESRILRRAVRAAAAEIMDAVRDNPENLEDWLPQCIEDIVIDSVCEVFDLEGEEIFW